MVTAFYAGRKLIIFGCRFAGRKRSPQFRSIYLQKLRRWGKTHSCQSYNLQMLEMDKTNISGRMSIAARKHCVYVVVCVSEWVHLCISRGIFSHRTEITFLDKISNGKATCTWNGFLTSQWKERSQQQKDFFHQLNFPHKTVSWGRWNSLTKPHYTDPWADYGTEAETLCFLLTSNVLNLGLNTPKATALPQNEAALQWLRAGMRLSIWESSPGNEVN